MPVIMEEDQKTTPSTNGKGSGDTTKKSNGGKCPYSNYSNGSDARAASPSVVSEGCETSIDSSLMSPQSDTGNESMEADTGISQDENQFSIEENGEMKAGSKNGNEASDDQANDREGNVNASNEPGNDDQSKKEPETQDNEEFRTLSLNLILPGVPEPIEVMQIAKDTVNDLLQYAFERPECCYRTCLAVYFKGKRIDNFVELGTVEGLVSGCTMELVEVPYALRDILIHVQRLQELLGSNPLQQSISCTAGLSLSMLSSLIHTDLESDTGADQSIDPALLDPPSFCLPPDQSPSSSPAPPSSTPPLMSFYPEGLEKHYDMVECLRSLSFSSWNPPTANRRFKGDILYLEVVTLEGEVFCITATPSGFFINRTVPGGTTFDPHPRKVSHHSHHLITLLQQISPLFRKNYSMLQKYGEKKHVYEVFPVPYPVYPWIVPKQEARPQPFRLDDTMGLKVPTDELLVGQLRDWNEEFQTTRELPGDTLPQRVFKDRALFKVHSDFVHSAVKGAMAAVDGQLHPLNPADPDKHHMYLWNNIFFSTGIDGRGHFKDFGGEEAGHAAANYDLQGVSIIEKIGIEGLHTLGAVLIDYRGYRVFAQSIVPGLLQKDHESSIIYGSMDNGKTISRNKKFHELMLKCSRELNLRPHKISTKSGEVVEVPISVEVKGIEGNDGRQYALDLFRILPPDANYADPGLVTGEFDSTKGRPSASEFAVRHKLCLLRPELVESYIGTLALQLHLSTLQKNLAKRSKHGKQAIKKKGAESKEEEKEEGEEDNETGTEQDKQVTVETENRTEEKEREGEDQEQTKGDPSSEESTSKEDGSEKEERLENEDTEVEEKEIPEDSLVSISVKDLLVQGSSKKNGGGEGTTVLDADSLLLEGGARKLHSEEEFELIGGNGSSSDLMDILVIDRMDLTESKEDTPELSVSDEGVGTLVKESTQNETGNNDSSSNNDDQDYLLNLYDDLSIRFNADIFTAGLKNEDSKEQQAKDRKRCLHLAQYLVSVVIPKFLKECLYLNIMPLDGMALKSQLHSRGINMRYLGRIAQMAGSRNDLQHIYRLCVTDMTLRTAKRKLRRVLVETPLHRTVAAVSHFLNCLLSDVNDGSIAADEVTSSTTTSHKKKNKKKKGGAGGGKNTSTSHREVLTQGSLWKWIKDDVKLHYRYNLEFSSLNHAFSECCIQKISILREFCVKMGIQILLREYNFSLPAPFSEEDVVSIVPVVKYTHYRPVEATGIYELAYARLNAGNIKFAHQLLMEAIQLAAQIYGPMHHDIAKCYRLLARIHNSLGEPQMAIKYQYKAALMYERLSGVDHCTTLSAYFSLGQYCLQVGKLGVALKLFYRVKYLTLLSHGEDHPEVANVDFQIAICLCNLKKYPTALKFLYNTLSIQMKYYGKECVPIAISHTLAANALAELGEFREAIRHEKIAFSIYKNKLGEEHEKTKKSSDCLKLLTERAVFVQKQIKMVTDSQTGLVAAAEIPGSWWDVFTKHADYTQSKRNQRHSNSSRTSGARRKHKPSTSGNTSSLSHSSN